VAPFTANTMPEGTLKALADHRELGVLLPADGGDSEAVLAWFGAAASTSTGSAPGSRTRGRRRS
jgi:hypothetical protein